MAKYFQQIFCIYVQQFKLIFWLYLLIITNMSEFLQTQTSRQQDHSNSQPYLLKFVEIVQALKKIQNMKLVNVQINNNQAHFLNNVETQKKIKLQFALGIKADKNRLSLKLKSKEKIKINLQQDLQTLVNLINVKQQSLNLEGKIFTYENRLAYTCTKNLCFLRSMLEINLRQFVQQFTQQIKTKIHILSKIYQFTCSQFVKQFQDQFKDKQNQYETCRMNRPGATMFNLIGLPFKSVQQFIVSADNLKKRQARNSFHAYQNNKNSVLLNIKLQMQKQNIIYDENLQSSQALGEEMKNKIYKKANMLKYYIYKPICILNQKYISAINFGGFGSLSIQQCMFAQLDTIENQSQKFIDEQLRRNKIVIQRKEIKDILVRKVPKDKTPSSQKAIRTQNENLEKLKQMQCPQIAQFYKLIVKKQTLQKRQFDDNCVYSKYYPLQFQRMYSLKFMGKIKVLLDLIKGIEYLSDINFVHRDIKPENIRLTQQRKVKIIDFGSAGRVYDPQHPHETQKFARTRQYGLDYSKLVLQSYISQQEYNRHKFYDMYAYGIILEKLPNTTLTNGSIEADSLRYIIQKCKENNPHDRLSPEQVRSIISKIIKFREVWKKKLLQFF